jgi:hypothetical protein
MSILVRNERVKLAASYLNSIASATLLTVLLLSGLGCPKLPHRLWELEELAMALSF